MFAAALLFINFSVLICTCIIFNKLNGEAYHPRQKVNRVVVFVIVGEWTEGSIFCNDKHEINQA